MLNIIIRQNFTLSSQNLRCARKFCGQSIFLRGLLKIWRIKDGKLRDERDLVCVRHMRVGAQAKGYVICHGDGQVVEKSTRTDVRADTTLKLPLVYAMAIRRWRGAKGRQKEWRGDFAVSMPNADQEHSALVIAFFKRNILAVIGSAASLACILFMMILSQVSVLSALIGMMLVGGILMRASSILAFRMAQKAKKA